MFGFAGVPTQYMLIQGRLQEVNWFKERFRSWFVGDAVIDHGSLYLSTPVDPLFIALSILEASRQQVDSAALSTQISQYCFCMHDYRRVMQECIMCSLCLLTACRAANALQCPAKTHGSA